MYINMEVKLLGLTFRIEVVVLCILLGWILGAHLFCSCVRITPYEGFQMIKSSVENMMSNASFLDYKMSAGIELKKNPEKEVVGFMEDFKKDHESIGFQSSCKA